MEYIPIAEAQKQLQRISDELDEPLLLIGGLAVHQYVITRDSEDIDLICDYHSHKEFLKKLYPSDEWNHTDENNDEYRPAYTLIHKTRNYPTIRIGPKMIERGSYRFLNWDFLKTDAPHFRYQNEPLKNILIPPVEALCYSKIVSFMGRSKTHRAKLKQDLSDVREMSNHNEFQLGVFVNHINRMDFSVELGEKFGARVAELGESLEGSNFGTLISLFAGPAIVAPSPARTNQLSELQPRPTSVPSTKRIRLVAFDLDGTLLKGIRHSWTVVWNILNGDKTAQIDRKEKFRKGELSYLDWCKLDGKDCIDSKLTRDHFKEIVASKTVSLTKNLREGIEKLKENDIKTAIISGGIDALLYELLPDADDLFDEILINRFVFNEDGIFEGISATEYDWDDSKVGVVGKRRGLERICEKYDISVDDSAFVGDDLNDIEAMRAAGLKMFYCADAREFTADSKSFLPKGITFIPENDLMAVVNRILFPPSGEQVD